MKAVIALFFPFSRCKTSFFYFETLTFTVIYDSALFVSIPHALVDTLVFKAKDSRLNDKKR